VTGGDSVFQYMTGQMKESQPALLAAFERESAEAVAALRPAVDIPYGPHPRQRFDFFQATAGAATLAYFHAGYWQARDKAQFRFIAPALAQIGFNVALVNYPLCPDVTLAALTEAVRDCVPAIRAFADAQRHGAARLIVAGHSAGGHLAAELALTDWPARGVVRDAVSGVVALSGIYDLEPLLDTPLNDRLRLDRPACRAASPIRRVRRGMPPGLFAAGGLETTAFQTQTANMHAAWQASGNDGEALIIAAADHFSLLRNLTMPGDPLFEAVGALL
jgi:arylformamidase